MCLFWILLVTKDTFYSFLIRVNQLIRRNYSICTLFHEKNTKYKPHCSRKWCKIERFWLEKCLMWWCYNRIWTRWYSESRDSSKTVLIKQKNKEFLRIFRKQLFLTENQNFGFETCIFSKNWNIFAHFWRIFISFREQKSNFLPLLTRKMTQRKWSWLTIRISSLVYGF